jgi:hypothetical protein
MTRLLVIGLTPVVGNSVETTLSRKPAIAQYRPGSVPSVRAGPMATDIGPFPTVTVATASCWPWRSLCGKCGTLTERVADERLVSQSTCSDYFYFSRHWRFVIKTGLRAAVELLPAILSGMLSVLLPRFKSRDTLIQARNGLVEAALRGGPRRANGDAQWCRAHRDRSPHHRVGGGGDHRDGAGKSLEPISKLRSGVDWL